MGSLLRRAVVLLGLFGALASPGMVLAAPQAAPALSVDQILAKFVQALGGKAALEKVTSRLTTGTLDAGEGRLYALEIREKAPDKFLFIVLVEGQAAVKRGFDGAVGWEYSAQQGISQLSGATLGAFKRSSQFYRWLRLKELFRKLEAKGTSEVGDRTAYVVEATPEDGNPEILYFDTQTFLLLRRDIRADLPDGSTVPLETYYDDYRQVDGIKSAFSLRQVRPDSVLILRYTQVRQNVPLDDAEFAKPAGP